MNLHQLRWLRDIVSTEPPSTSTYDPSWCRNSLGFKATLQKVHVAIYTVKTPWISFHTIHDTVSIKTASDTVYTTFLFGYKCHLLQR